MVKVMGRRLSTFLIDVDASHVALTIWDRAQREEIRTRMPGQPLTPEESRATSPEQFKVKRTNCISTDQEITRITQIKTEIFP
jgi:hypothetical protein